MRYLLNAAHLEVLAQLAWSKALLAFDFDGTLSPIIQERNAAIMRAPTRGLFQQVCQLYPVAVISGRARADVAERVRGCGVRYVIGNHGLEPGTDLRAAKRALDGVRAQVAALSAKTPGIEVEDKRYSLAVHYRKAKNPTAAHAAILRAIAAVKTPMRQIAGKCVVNVVPAEAPHKGDAVLALRSKARADTALYVGDDVTDEDVFRIDEPGRLLTVRVGRSSKSAAAYFLKTQLEIDALLSRLIAFRSRLNSGRAS